MLTCSFAQDRCALPRPGPFSPIAVRTEDSPQSPPPSFVSQAHWRVHASRWRSSWARVRRCPTPSGFGHRRVAGELQCYFDPGRGLGRRVGWGWGGVAVAADSGQRKPKVRSRHRRHPTRRHKREELLTSLLHGRYCNPPNWKRNTGIVLVGWAVAAYFTFKFSAANERRLSPPYHHIPSQQWCAWAKHDDPSLPR